MLEKHSAVCYIFERSSGYRPEKKAHTVKNDMGLDLFRFNNRLYEGQTGLQIHLSLIHIYLCTEILKELFMDDLSVWKEQKKSNDDLYRFDLICKIRDGRVNPFWRFLEEFFNTKYIIFEFKNYKEAITQKEIYTTEKYLYAKALRSVAIILSCHGADKNAEKAIKGALRENGKLIISISNEDIIHMLEAKKNNEEPSDDLYTMLDNMLMALEK